MTAEEAKTVHRPGLFKLPNKKHRTGRHRSKHEIARDNNGQFFAFRFEERLLLCLTQNVFNAKFYKFRLILKFLWL